MSLQTNAAAVATADLFGDVKSSAVISQCGRYRYSLTRTWDSSLPRVCFIMLNPSTADTNADDPTIRRCIGFAKRFGYGALEVVNLFAWRATDPDDLRRAIVTDPVGPENDEHILSAVFGAEITIAAWGVEGTLHGRDREVMGHHPYLQCLGVTQAGHPRHPLYLAADTPLERLDMPAPAPKRIYRPSVARCALLRRGAK